ncbi:MAG: class I SAM-dependent methyltransferase [Oscillatoriophycideae cyanobacterium NC_groundwater_1537_Pr4_S-0.65um_50_18]|nr:class I SAM-dependent methyltransferase [Oscillatoriophycideae cyanobacterium NC_groundwater_1537_Pr4_S-0.65um_50_18]
MEIEKGLPPLHAQNPTGRFSERAIDYAKFRPTYPLEAIDLTLENLSHVDSMAALTAADIGAGTGISSRLLADQGVKVWAIEPNAAMRKVAVPHPLVDYREGTAEQTGLADGAVDLVLCCQSFHWFNKTAALTEFRRILQPRGRVALIWNERNLEDELTYQYSEALRLAADRQIFDWSDRKSPEALATSPHFTHYRSHAITHRHPLTPEGLIGLALSSSYIPKQGAAHDQLISDLQALCASWVAQLGSDSLALSYVTHLYLAEVGTENF